MKLFAVDTTFFSNKKEAKVFRNTVPGSKVSKGPDHWKFSDKPARQQEKKRKNRKN